MKKFLAILMVILTISCNQQKNDLKLIEETENNIKKSKNFDKVEAQKLIDLYLNYATKYPEDTLVPKMLYSATQYSIAISNPKQALECINRLIEKYPKFKLIPEALITKAMIYETQLNDKNSARKYYLQFLKNYPQHPLVNDIKQNLKILDLPDEEIIEKLSNNTLTLQ